MSSITSTSGSARVSLLLALYTLSGLTSLGFEVLWARMLALQFGVSIYGVVVTVAAFMAGLGLGSLAGLRWQARLRRPLLVFAALEGGVALYALVLPWLLAAAEGWLNGIAPGIGLGGWYTLQSLALLALMALPAGAMGAGFPLMLKVIASTPISLGRVYGVNACGAAVGALLPLWLLPEFGWAAAVQVVAAVGIVVGATAALLGILETNRSGPRATGVSAAPAPVPLSALVAYCVIGAAAIMLEIAWTRLFGMVLLRTEYVLAIILAVYLFGIGGGSLLARRLRHPGWFALLPLIAATAGVGSLWALPWISAWAEAREFGSLAAALWAEGGVLAAVTLPVTLTLGAWLPLLTARFGDALHHGARLYGINSLGAALGAGIAGFLLIPWVGTPVTVIVASLLLFLGGIIWAPSARWAWTLLLPLALAWPVREFPAVAVLLPGSQADARDLYRYEDAMAITHVIERADGQRLLLSDLQRMDASSEPAAVAIQKDQARLPLLLHDAPSSVLFLGLGTGISAAGSLPYDGLERTAVELSRGAIEAARRWFAPVNEGVMGRMRVIRDDVRRFLRVDAGRYDVIVGDVFHPDLVGRSALLSVQQFRRARMRLNDDGIFVQWLALNQFDLPSLRIVLRSFRREFPHAVMFMDGFRLALVGPVSGRPLGERFSDVGPGRDSGPGPKTGGEGVWTWLGRYWGVVPGGAGAVQDEWRPRIEFRLPHARYHREPDLAELLGWLLARRPGVEAAAAELGLASGRKARFERAYIATDLATRAWLAEIDGRPGEADRLIRFAYEANPRDRWISTTLADRMFATISQVRRRGLDRGRALKAILSVRPDHDETLRALWRLERAAGRDGEARKYLARLAAVSPLDKDSRKYNGLSDFPGDVRQSGADEN